MNAVRSDLAPLVGTERIACLLRLAVGLLLLAMTVAFEPVLPWLAVATTVTAVGWSALMFIALRSDLSAEHLSRLAAWSHWFDIVLALTVYGLFLTDPVATPVAGLPLLAFRLALRHGTVGVVAGGLAFVTLLGGRIAFTRLTAGELLVRPPMLLAWALVATVVLMLAAEARARAATLTATGSVPAAPVEAPAPEVAAAGAAEQTPAGDQRLTSLAACLALKLAAPTPAPLSQREVEVLLLLGQGHGYNAIAGRLFISQSTVRNHMHNVRTKLDIHDRAELLEVARALAARVDSGESRDDLASPV
jgi:DNA-binding CsgD family transcriptional regulator